MKLIRFGSINAEKPGVQLTNGIKLERFAVLKAHRGEGIGKYLVEQVIEEVQKHAKPIYLHAQIQVVDFYQKLGFEKEGALFEEAGIQHF